MRAIAIAGSRWLRLLVFGVAPLVYLGWLSWVVDGNGGGKVFAIFRSAARHVLVGHSPYRPATIRAIAGGDSYVYAEPFAYLFVPFARLNEHVGAVLFVALSALAVCVSIRLLGGRDWRLYGVALLTVPVYEALRLGAVGPLLLLLVAAGWRYRDRAAGGIFLAAAAAVKLFLWPVLVWLVLTRRLRGSVAAAATLAAVVGIWALTDLHGLHDYPTTLRLLNQVYRKGSYSSQALAFALGASRHVALAVSIALSIGGLGVLWLLRRRERDSFVAAVMISMATSPLLWMHYLVLLIVPLVLVSPSLSAWWLVLVPLWATPLSQSHGALWRLLVTWAVVVVVAFAPEVLSRRRPQQTALASSRPLGSAP